jgi:hypothetical protein
MAAGRKSDKHNRNGISAQNCYIVALPWSIARTYVNVNSTKRYGKSLFSYDKETWYARERHTTHSDPDFMAPERARSAYALPAMCRCGGRT